MTLAAAPAAERHEAPPLVVPVARRRPRPWIALGGLTALVALAVALRLEGIGTWYWIDEALSVGIARHDLIDIPGVLARDGSPPLWYLLLHLWTGAFGTSAVATHAMSLVFAVAAVPAAWYAGRRLHGSRAGWIAAALATISPFITYFGRETRMYSLVALLGIVVAASFIETFVDGARRAAPLFATSMVALLYTHNWALYVLAGCAAALVPLWWASADRSAITRKAAVLFGIVGVAYLPWLPTLLSQVGNTGAPWSYTPSAREVVREVAALFRDERVLAALVPAAAVGLGPLVRRWRSREGLVAVTLTLLIAVPIVIGWVIAHVEPSWATRYLAAIVGPLVLLVAMGLSRVGATGIAAVALAATLILQPFSRAVGTYELEPDVKSNGRAVAEIVAARLRPGDAVIVVQPEAVPLIEQELGPELTYADPMGRVEDPSVMDWRNAEQRLRASTVADVAPVLDGLDIGERVLLVLPGNPARDTDTAWIDVFRAKGRAITRALRTDPSFQIVERVRGPDRSYVTFDAVLFERAAPAR